jgi:hypothetical protein
MQKDSKKGRTEEQTRQKKYIKESKLAYVNLIIPAMTKNINGSDNIPKGTGLKDKI